MGQAGVRGWRLGGWRVAILSALLLAVPVTLRAAGDEEKAVARTYRTAPASPRSQTSEAADAKSVGCISCHSASDAPSMHLSTAVVLGCVDCHGGDPGVIAPTGLRKGQADYARLRDRAHVLPRYPADWKFPSSANPQQSYTLLNRDLLFDCLDRD